MTLRQEMEQAYAYKPTALTEMQWCCIKQFSKTFVKHIRQVTNDVCLEESSLVVTWWVGRRLSVSAE